MSHDTPEDAPVGDPVRDLFRTEMRGVVSALREAFGSAAIANPPDVAPLVEAARTARGAGKLLGSTAIAELGRHLETTLATLAEGGSREAIAAAVLDVAALFHDTAQSEAETLSAWETSQHDAIARCRAAFELPEPVPTVTVAAGPAINATLFDLFREEVQTHAATLSTGILELENDPANPQRIEPLMRAAHSIKGAARIVGVDLAVDLAHVLEDVFVAAQRGRLRIASDDVDTFLRAADLFAGLHDVSRDGLSQWGADHAPEGTRLIATLEAILKGTPKPTPVIPPAAPALQPAPTPPAATAAAPEPPAATAKEITPAPRIEVPPAGTPVAEENDSIVRVSAQSLNRFMGLAGESLVQARWLQPFANSLLKFKKMQDRLARSLDTFVAWQSTHPLPDSAREIVDDLRRQVSDCQQTFTQRMGEFEEYGAAADDLNLRLYREVIASRMRPFADGTHGFARIVRDMARTLGKKVRLEILGQSTEVDRDILEKLDAPLTHMIRNAVDHGLETPDVRSAAGKPETGTLRVEARHRAGTLMITIADDGRGIDCEKVRTKIVDRNMVTAEMAKSLNEQELLEFLFLPGFSTAQAVTEYSGRGVGLDVVQEMIRVVGGTVRITSKVGQGTTFHLTLPVTLSVVRAVLVVIAGESYAFPHNRIDRLLRLPMTDVHSLENRQFVSIDGKNVGLIWASQLLGLTTPTRVQETVSIVLIADISGQYGLIVDCFTGEQDLVVRPLDARLGKVPNISAAAVLDDGTPVLIADVEDLLRSTDHYIQAGSLKRTVRREAIARRPGRKKVLVVDDSVTVREVERQLLREMGHEVIIATDGQDGWNRLRSEHFDLVVSDIDMPRMNGLELLRLIRADAEFATIPVIIVSYKDRDEDRQKGLDLGANYYLMKSSFHDNRFREAVEDVLS
jgi:two-component system, chemotaxis family, sensor histidine kinase and response regulator WspE